MMTSNLNIQELNSTAFYVFGLIKHTTQSIFLTGEAGTGKSTLIDIIEKFGEKSIIKMAFSGIAAQNIGGHTIHSTFKIPFNLPKDAYPLSFEIKKKLISTDLIIIDEISLVSRDFFDFIDKLLRFNLDKEKPFGGKQILLVGDPFQLPPVKNDIMFFESKKFVMNYFEYIELTEIYRQKDFEFCSILKKIRLGVISEQEVEYLNNICFGRKFKEVIRLTAHIRNSNHHNDTMLNTINRKAWVFEGEITGNFNLKDVLTPQTLKLKVGARIMTTKNNKIKGYFNGTQGIIKEISDEYVLIVTDEKKELKIYRENWQKVDPSTEKEIGNFYQFPLMLGWAITIHKSQGLTFNKLEIDLGSGAFEFGQLYTAISRCTSLEGLSFLSKINLRDIKVNQKAKIFMSNLNNEIQKKLNFRNLDKLIKILDERELIGLDM